MQAPPAPSHFIPAQAGIQKPRTAGLFHWCCVQENRAPATGAAPTTGGPYGFDDGCGQFRLVT
jgi:hypothetical protein